MSKVISKEHQDDLYDLFREILADKPKFDTTGCTFSEIAIIEKVIDEMYELAASALDEALKRVGDRDAQI